MPTQSNLPAKDSTPPDRHGQPPIPSDADLAKLPPDGGPNWNRLVFEKSPYLLQHAANPVDWRPWGEEAFETARRQDKPVFLSIGYSTCHWCHVMERESFEDEEVAALLNEHYVPIKVDREERPDVDQLYMSVCMALNGSGGWPLTVVMTPDKLPFFAGTYYPKHGALGRPGLIELLTALANVWKTDRQRVVGSADQIARAIRDSAGGSPAERHLVEATLETAYLQLYRRYDTGRGGFGGQPKFPSAHNLSFLLRYGRRYGDSKARTMVEKTLREMRLGGICDHLGFGFHRYSTDEDWLVPHFEKMLCDQAMLAIAYTEAFQAAGDEEYARAAREILAYVLRDMISPEGGFYSAEDADSEGQEGQFYLWSAEEIRSALGPEEAGLFMRVYNVHEHGNYRDEAGGRETGRNILHLKKPLSEIAKELKADEAELRRRLEAARATLFDIREARVHPGKDDKILTDWNGLMIAALAKAAQALGEPRYAEAARKAADFILSNMRGAKGRLLKRWRGGEAGLPGLLDDYAFLVWGLLELYEAAFEVRYLREAIDINDLMLRHFRDDNGGGLFLTPDDGEPLLVRAKEVYDGAIPSGNSVAALNLLRLNRITGKTEYEEKGQGILRAFAGAVAPTPSAHCQLMIALDFSVGPSLEIVVAGKPNAPDVAAMLEALRRPFIPNKVVLLRPDGPGASAMVQIAPYVEGQKSLDGAATAYVCRNFSCQAPTTDPQALARLLAEPYK